MPQYKAPLTDMQFLLHEVFQAPAFLAAMPATRELSADLLNAILEEAARITQQMLSPINQSGDDQGCRFDNGQVKTPAGFKDAYRVFAEGGWGALTGDPSFGGQGMPKMLAVLFEEMLFAANASFALYPILTNGATLALSLHGSEELKEKFLPKLYAGQWTGTMCLTEAHAGTDLGIMYTRAEPANNGTYHITGTKIFITAGEHDLTENIIHFVLAKLPDAPDGARGISLFLVPRLRIDEAGNIAGENGVSCGSLEHKMGLKGSATCVMNFDQSEGFLVGEAHQGLTCMFTMMNYERLSMGLQGIGLADASYQVASAYAMERLQGRASAGPVNPGQVADPIIVHPDVRRMLLTMRANIMAGRALVLYVATKLDTVKFSDDAAEQDAARQLVELLTPVAKAYCTDCGFQDCVLGQQVLGGHGYISEWGQEQFVRDARIAQIYEGTNGIQALDLMGRKTVRCNGQYLEVLLAEMDEFIAGRESVPALKPYCRLLKEARDSLAITTRTVIEKASADTSEIGSASYSYLEMIGCILYGYMWARIIAAAVEGNTGDYDQEYLHSLQQVAAFYFTKLFPRYKFLAEDITAGGSTIMALDAARF